MVGDMSTSTETSVRQRSHHTMAEVFRAIAHPTRVAILDLLRYVDLPVNSICERLNLAQANVSQHLMVLRAQQLVTTRRVSNQVFYAVGDSRVGELLDTMLQFLSADTRSHFKNR